MYKNLIFTVIMMASFVGGALAQSSQDSIIQQGNRASFRMDGKILSEKKLRKVCESNPEAYNYMLKAKRNNDVAFPLGFIGGFLVGYQLGSLVSGGESQWELVVIGAPLIIASIPFSVGYAKNAKKAVEVYNSGLATSLNHQPKLNLTVSSNGIGLRINF